ncbi:BCD family MFS transporter [Erythrobacter sanguineus]|uniref:MFS transporter, BCD family, chlorophyll transporter n=1 Tax=Erythrobacter sanguineus TaxID=198312 RepID=A0A1M7RZE7_9SPHN|nr:BCD family MFS transporter [Erythrobacter sanguineus]SHN51605.1 MFS transporter, BCD family, chlorophyll transporter [Erythrobacter sanguineus]
MHAPLASPPAEAGNAGFGWLAIARIGLVQASIGALVMLATTVLNRVMVVELGLLAAIPAGLVAWHYAVQLGRPLWGHASDKGNNRTKWIIGGVAVLAAGALLATQATVLIATSFVPGFALAVLAYTLIGAGVGAGGTSALALLASGVAPQRRAAAAAVTWIMMVAGIVSSAFAVSPLIEPFTYERLVVVAGGLALVMVTLTVLATFRLERQAGRFGNAAKDLATPDFRAALSEIWHEPAARRFTIFIFVSMIAFSMQDLILEPFAGLIFGMSPGESTKLGGQHQGGILLGMIITGIGGSAFSGKRPDGLRIWVVGGCVASAIALGALGVAAINGPPWPLGINVFILGLGNGVFAVAAIGAMMGLAGAGENTREGVRMGVWGASQAIAFGLGGLTGAVGVDLARSTLVDDGAAFQLVFSIEAAAFLLAAVLAVKATGAAAMRAGVQEVKREVFA